MQRRAFLIGLSLSVSAATAGCTGDGTDVDPTILEDSITLATATSVDDTGVLQALNEAFTDRFGAEVRTVAQGTGAALATARNGDADLVLTHARELEDAFMRDGYGVNRRTVMVNDFVIVGPESDPAGVTTKTSVIEAFEAIAAAEVLFISRGDQSGTHIREAKIWAATGIDPDPSWYRETGVGMGELLSHANLVEQEAYALTDRGTFLAMRSELDIDIRFESDGTLLENPYGIMAVNPATHAHVAYDLAMAYIGFVTSPIGQSIIESFEVDGEPLFHPIALAEETDFSQYGPTDAEEPR